MDPRPPAKVYLVGAGPGDPGLITHKGRTVLQFADCVLYDHLAASELLELVPPHAELIDVGKTKDHHNLAQEDITQLLVERGMQGLTVVRLKGGDPFIFGRGGEELEALADAGIPFEVVPGVTSALGIAAYTGVPLTHREHTSAVTFVTGHHVPKIEWDKAGRSDTLVIFMGLHHIEQITQELIAKARPASTPAMAVQWGTTARQRTVTGTLENLSQRVREANLKAPAAIFVGDVVTLHDRLNWFERLPLFGRTIVVTRPRGQAPALGSALRALGADVLNLPTIEIAPPLSYEPLDGAIEHLADYDWLLFTSANGVRVFFDRLDASASDLRQLRAKVAAIGPMTRAAVEACHIKVDLVPEEYVAESVVAAFAHEDVFGKRFLIPRAAIARDVIPNALRARGAQVYVVDAYRTIPCAHSASQIQELFSEGNTAPDWVTFTSSSTVHHFASSVPAEVLRRISAASIGPVTSATLREYGVTPSVEAKRYTAAGLVDAILAAR